MATLSKAQKKLLFLAGVFLLLTAAFFLLISYWANQRLSDILGDRVESKHIEVSIIGNRIKFDEPSVVIDSTGDGTVWELNAAAKSILIDGFGIWDLLFNEKIAVGDFIVDSLEVNMVLGEQQPSHSRRELNLFVKDVFSQIEVGHMEVINSGFLASSRSSDTMYHVVNFELSADGIVVDTATKKNPFPLDFERSEITIDEIFLRLGEDYTLSGQSLLIRDTTFSITNLKLNPLYNREEWVRSHPYEKARITVSSDLLKMKRLLWDLEGDAALTVTSSSALLESLKINVFKDKSPPQEPLHVKPLISTLIKELPFTITIDTVELKDSYISYEQRPVQYPRAGILSFEKLYMTTYNLTNDTSRIQENGVTTMNVLCQFMGEGELSTTIKLLMQSTDGEFEVSGKLGRMPVTYVNQVLAPLAGAEAEGQVHEIVFDFKGDNYKCEGDLRFHYEGLKVTMVDDKRDKKWLLSMLGNLALKNSNTIEQDNYQQGDIYFVRYQNKDFWNFLWNGVRTGLVDVVVPFYSNPDRESGEYDGPKYKEES